MFPRKWWDNTQGMDSVLGLAGKLYHFGTHALTLEFISQLGLFYFSDSNSKWALRIWKCLPTSLVCYSDPNLDNLFRTVKNSTFTFNFNEILDV